MNSSVAGFPLLFDWTWTWNCGEKCLFHNSNCKSELKWTKKSCIFSLLTTFLNSVFQNVSAAFVSPPPPAQYLHVVLLVYYMREDQSLSSCELLGSETSSFSFLFKKKRTQCLRRSTHIPESLSRNAEWCRMEQVATYRAKKQCQVYWNKRDVGS